jgi:hypothetical protein
MRGIPACMSKGSSLPDRERRCIFAAAAAFAAFAALVVVPTMVEDCLVFDAGAEEEDMDA